MPLYASTIGGDLGCDSAHIETFNLERTALRVDRTTITGNVLLRKYFKAEGVVSFSGATIGGNLQCEDGQFINRGGDALLVQRAKIGGNLNLSGDFKATGKVNLYGATIAGDLGCDGGHFDNPTEVAVQMDSASITGSVLFRRCCAEGVVVAESPLAPSPRIAVNASLKSPVEIPLS